MPTSAKQSLSEIPLEHPLSGIAAKIQRTEESIHALDKEISRYLNSDPRPHRVVGKMQGDNLKFVFTAFTDSPLPLRFSVLAGEIIHHLRSCFDHLVVALAQYRGQMLLTAHQFPVCRTPEKFEQACKRSCLKGVGNEAFDRISKAQPYHHKNPESYTLAAIHALDIRDKHNLLLVVTSVAQIGNTLEVGGSKPDGPPIEITNLGDPTPRKVSKEGAEIFSITLAQPAPDFHAKAGFDAQVCFEQCGSTKFVPVIAGLTMMTTFTRQFVEEFRAYFDASA